MFQDRWSLFSDLGSYFGTLSLVYHIHNCVFGNDSGEICLQIPAPGDKKNVNPRENHKYIRLSIFPLGGLAFNHMALLSLIVATINIYRGNLAHSYLKRNHLPPKRINLCEYNLFSLDHSFSSF